VVTGAELFVILSGIVTGMIHGKYILKYGWKYSAMKLFHRSKKLYLTIVISSAAVWAIATTTSFGTNLIYRSPDEFGAPLQPLFHANTLITLKNIILIYSCPSQINILGLYVFLLLLSPFALWLLQRQKWFLLLSLSFIIYLIGFKLQMRLSRLAFESAFPFCCWQFPFMCALTIGYHYNCVLKIIQNRVAKFIRVLVALLFFVFLFYTLNNYWTGANYGGIPSKLRLSFIPPDTFDLIYANFFLSVLGCGRVV
jgi:hypothetical protein